MRCIGNMCFLYTQVFYLAFQHLTNNIKEHKTSYILLCVRFAFPEEHKTNKPASVVSTSVFFLVKAAVMLGSYCSAHLNT